MANEAKKTEQPFVGNPQSADDWPQITMYGQDFRDAMHAMHTSITELKLWEEMKKEPGRGGFTFASDDYIDKIYDHALNVKQGHSGYTQAYCMRVMQQIAREGWIKFTEAHQAKPAKLNPVADAFGVPH